MYKAKIGLALIALGGLGCLAFAAKLSVIGFYQDEIPAIVVFAAVCFALLWLGDLLRRRAGIDDSAEESDDA